MCETRSLESQSRRCSDRAPDGRRARPGDALPGAVHAAAASTLAALPRRRGGDLRLRQRQIGRSSSGKQHTARDSGQNLDVRERPGQAVEAEHHYREIGSRIQ